MNVDCREKLCRTEIKFKVKGNAKFLREKKKLLAFFMISDRRLLIAFSNLCFSCIFVKKLMK